MNNGEIPINTGLSLHEDLSTKTFSMATTPWSIRRKILSDPIKFQTLVKPLIHDEKNEVPVRWIKNLLCQAKEMQKNENEPPKDFKIIPTEEEQLSAFKRQSFTNFLLEIDLLPPKDDQDHWAIPATFTQDHLQTLHDYFLHDLLVGYFQDDFCKVCKKEGKSIIQHIKKKASCRAHYTDDEMEELRLGAKCVTNENKKDWAKANKDQVKASNAKHYQQNKAKKAAYYQQNKEKIGKKMAEYHNKNYNTINRRKAFYYFENKDKWAKKTKKEEVLKDQVNDKPETDYSLKRTPIDFTMDDLEAEAEDEDEFKANIEPMERKTLPSRKCSQKINYDL